MAFCHQERGAEKERRFFTELMQKQFEEERARVPKANPYPYTTDYPVVQKLNSISFQFQYINNDEDGTMLTIYSHIMQVPPKPEPKQCTKPEPFQLESLVRHEEELQREMEERRRMEEHEAQMRIFKAQPVLKE